MKTLHLVRHADSGFAGYGISDFERILTAQGISDAQMMSKRLLSRGANVEMIVSSSATRAKNTALIFLETLSVETRDFQLKDELYEAVLPVFFNIIEELPDDVSGILIVAHNPGLSEFANSFSVFPPVSLPSAGVFSLQFDTDTWRDLGLATPRFLYFDYPGQEDA